MSYYSTREPPFVLKNKTKNKVTGKSLGPRSDAELSGDISERFRALVGIDTSTVAIEVEGHIAVLRGSVANARVKQLLLDVSENVPGVKEVKSTLQVDAVE